MKPARPLLSLAEMRPPDARDGASRTAAPHPPRTTPRRRRRPTVRRVEVPVVGLDPRLSGLTIAHLSDIHVSALSRPRLLERALDLVSAERAELALLTGDYVCLSLRSLPRFAAALRRLAVPALATLGNHDHNAGAAEVSATLLAAGIRVLRNEHATVRLRGAELHVVGVDDGATHHADPDRAFRAVPAAGLRIALTHDPRQTDRVAAHRPHLILAGHTHGGQVDVPGVTRRIMRRRGFHYLGGEYEVLGARVYVNRGLGASLPLRVRVPSEIAFLTLVSAP